MRIIAGRNGGIRLDTLKGDNTRPTSDKIKESLFSIIRDYIENSTCLDAFAGSGALGLEAYSRGAKEVVFVDKSRAAIPIIKNNIKKLKCEEDSKIIQGNIINKLDFFEENQFKFNLIFVDPPYSKGLSQQFLEKYCSSKVFDSNAIVVVEHHIDENLSDIYGEFELFKTREYGITCLKLYRRKI